MDGRHATKQRKLEPMFKANYNRWLGRENPSRPLSLPGVSPPCSTWKSWFCLTSVDDSRDPGLSYAPLLQIYALTVLEIDNPMAPAFPAVWGCNAMPSLHDSSWLIFCLNSFEAMLKVLGDSPHSIKGKPLVVQSMPLYFDFSPPVLVYAPVWVRLPNLLLECWTPECMSKICSVLGMPLHMDTHTIKMTRPSFARIMVELDLTGMIAPPVNHIGFEVTPPMNITDAIPLDGFPNAKPVVTLSPINIGLLLLLLPGSMFPYMLPVIIFVSLLFPVVHYKDDFCARGTNDTNPWPPKAGRMKPLSNFLSYGGLCEKGCSKAFLCRLDGAHCSGSGCLLNLVH
ncbi:hypothetical protein DKX38_013424 [Salix brachista]|uniref:Uncharacterized protein n=1 Tax=Salix brachista TaxID=2182728 RepID=A0A5N5LRV5_9ROSI|nr:hypothetical protein DKX38_013424 [Salix brachista]